MSKSLYGRERISAVQIREYLKGNFSAILASIPVFDKELAISTMTARIFSQFVPDVSPYQVMKIAEKIWDDSEAELHTHWLINDEKFEKAVPFRTPTGEIFKWELIISIPGHSTMILVRETVSEIQILNFYTNHQFAVIVKPCPDKPDRRLALHIASGTHYEIYTAHLQVKVLETVYSLFSQIYNEVN